MRPGQGQFPGGKVPLKIKPRVGKRRGAGSCAVIVFIHSSNIDFLLVSKAIGDLGAGFCEGKASKRQDLPPVPIKEVIIKA